ncbi:TPA: lytic transglycosylase domain-containing protein, partial [Klebsiella pneumoniae]
MNAETLKDFLISLGFKVDEAGARKFDAVVAGTTLKAIELGVKVEAAALSVVAFTAKIASGLDDLYWASQRTGATVEGIKQIGYAVSQVGGSVDGARGSLENLARFMRNNPGAEGFLNRLGVQTRDASGNMRDMATIFTGVGQRLSSMPYYRANQYAQMLGLDENTLMAMRRGIGQFSGEYTAMAKAIGYNADVAAVSSNKFMTSLRSFGLMAGMARDKIGSNLANGLAGSIDTLRRQIMENFPKIEGAITAGVKGVLWFGEIIGRVVYRLIQLTGDIINWWKSLGTETRQVIEVFGALMIAWRLLNSAFAMSPIGRVIMLGAALIGLYDDYRTWKEGGQSLIDWGKWEPGIKYAQKAFSSLSKDFGGIYVKVKDLGSAIVDLGKRFLEFINIDTSKFNGKWLFDQIIESVRSSIKILGSLVDALRKVISGDFSGAWDSLKGAAAAWSDSPVIQGAASVGQGLWDKAVDWWNGDATQYGQSV